MSLGQGERDGQIGLRISADGQVAQGVEPFRRLIGGQPSAARCYKEGVVHFQVPKMRHQRFIAFKTGQDRVRLRRGVLAQQPRDCDRSIEDEDAQRR